MSTIAPKRRGSPEAAIQRAIRDRLLFHGVMSVHVPNAGKRTIASGHRLKGEGMRPGFPDLICIGNGRTIFLEVKAPKGRLSPAQEDCHADMRRAGAVVAIVFDQDQAVAECRRAGLCA